MDKLTEVKERVFNAEDMILLFDHEKLMELAMARYRALMANREKLVEAWLAETGFAPSDSMIVEQHMDNGDVRVSVQRRNPEPFYNKLIPDETMLLIENQQKEIERLKAELKDARAISLSLRDRMYRIGCQLQEERTR